MSSAVVREFALPCGAIVSAAYRKSLAQIFFYCMYPTCRGKIGLWGPCNWKVFPRQDKLLCGKLICHKSALFLMMPWCQGCAYFQTMTHILISLSMIWIWEGPL